MADHLEIALLKKYPKAIYHLRAQLHAQKLMPVFGAGASKPIGLPNWTELVERISRHPRVLAESVTTGTTSQVSRVQLIFHHFRRMRLLELGNNGSIERSETTLLERTVENEWRGIVHDCLYQTAKPVDQHPYLRNYLSMVRRAPLTVNYNFDDTIQNLLDEEQIEGRDENVRGFETVWDSTVQFRYSTCVLYHPNGFLPREIYRGPSPRLVFLEDSFADQLIDAQRGHYATLLSHFYRYTSLLVGLSLEDATLKHLLRQSAQTNPGHVHYYVAFTSGAAPSPDRERAIRDANFNTYNLVTLFLTPDELGALGRLVAATDVEFASLADEAGNPESYVYYLTGAVGAGKTSSLAFFKSLRSYDEWPEEKPALLHQAADTLTEEQRQQIDAWIDRQMRRRNYAIHRDRHQLAIVDRSPLDPVAFAPDSSKRAGELKNLYAQSYAKVPRQGMLILLVGTADVMYSRTLDRHKKASPEYIARLQATFERLCHRAGPHAVVDTVDVTLHEVVRRVSRVIHLEAYDPADLGGLLESIGSSPL